ncbi:MAG: phosphate/phosphite/phosphonate ABC transporter substrate-binding protein [Planctomycetaceae bacterium]|nr:phosphate/phosphite/phosphonate ABC transporter substrate-binding protein [Planctomycetales bacterium]MCB9922935.1 phosphate/phosphite/phosphonate ABC transporter substrate-binding protein [Planctomycetaceae bacterium]
MSNDTILLGAVAYDAKVVTIWEGIREHFNQNGAPMDFVLFSNYERQVELLLKGHIDIAWNTPLAHVRVQKHTDGRSLSLGMRDTDQDFHSRVVIRSDSGINTLKDLEGKRLAVGSRDSTQARILPLHFLRSEGVDLAAVKLLKFDSDVGKHGDTGSSEIEVLEAVADGRAEAGTIGDLIWVNEQAAGHVDANLIRSLWTTPPYDHCMFDALPTLDPGKVERFQGALFGMRWDVPEHRRLLELEGLKVWMPPREEGYNSLRDAIANPMP